MDDSLEYTVLLSGEEQISLYDYMTGILGLSNRFTKKAAKEKRLFVNGQKADLRRLLSPEDKLKIIMDSNESQDIALEDISINIVYEDQDILIVDKPPFMLVHPTPNFPKGSLAAGVLYHFNKQQENHIVRLVSRLDRDTSGLVLIAKNAYAHMRLSEYNERNEIIKIYKAVVHGHMAPPAGTIDLPIGKDHEPSSFRRIVRSDGQKAITHYKTLEVLKAASVLELRLDTGRTHQIRVHLSHLGHSILGDSLYNSSESTWINRQALHAARLEFNHPRTDEALSFEVPFPQDIEHLIKQLEL